MNTRMNFIEKFELANRGAVEQVEPSEVKGTLLVGKKYIGRWEDRSRASSYGYDDVKIFPAIWKGQKCFIVSYDWCPAPGYSACGIEEKVVDLATGIQMMVEHGVYDFEEAAQVEE